MRTPKGEGEILRPSTRPHVPTHKVYHPIIPHTQTHPIAVHTHTRARAHAHTHTHTHTQGQYDILDGVASVTSWTDALEWEHQVCVGRGPSGGLMVVGVVEWWWCHG